MNIVINCVACCLSFACNQYFSLLFFSGKDTILIPLCWKYENNDVGI